MKDMHDLRMKKEELMFSTGVIEKVYFILQWMIGRNIRK